MSTWTDLDVAEYDAWLNEHDLAFQMNYKPWMSFKQLFNRIVPEFGLNPINEDYLYTLWEQNKK
jgi:hypothetical protein